MLKIFYIRADINQKRQLTMKKIKIILPLAIVAISSLILSCDNDSEIDVPDSLTGVLEEAHVIKYSSESAIEGKYIVVFKDGAFANSGRSVTSENYLEMKKEMVSNAQALFASARVPSKTIEQTFVKSIRGFAVELTDAELDLVRKDSRVAYIEQDQLITVSMGGPPGGGGGGGSDPQTTPWGISRVNGGVDGTGKVAYIIDSGIDASHPDLNVDVSRGFNAFSSGKDADLTYDGSGHGTHVAGTVGAIDNSIGVIGVAANATVVPVKVLNRRGSGSTSGVIAGVDYVATRSDCDAANMSLGGGISTALDSAVVSASSQCPFALAAGNSSAPANNSSPARAQGNNIYTVASMTSSDTWSSFSNYGVNDNPVDYIAPGSSVYSTYKDDGYATLSGTSMASPHVCGILLLGGISNGGTVAGPDGNYTVASN